MATAFTIRSLTLGPSPSAAASTSWRRRARSSTASTSRCSANCGASVVDAVMRCATVRWRRVSGTRSPGAAAGAGGGARGAGASRAGAGGAAGAAALTDDASPRAAASTSARTIRPSGPVPRTVAMSTPSSPARRRARGEAFVRPPFARTGAGRSGSRSCRASAASGSSSRLRLVGRAGPGVGLLRAELGADLRRGAVVGGGDAGGGVLLGRLRRPRARASRAAGADAPAPPISAMGSPTARASPSAAITWRVPSSGASTVIVALSVSISTSGWPLATASPSATSHWRTVPSSIVSLSLGIRSGAMSGLPPVPTRRRTAAITSGGEGRANCSRFFA